MKLYAVLASVGFAAVSCAPGAAPPDTGPFVFILTGQSNMVGQGSTAELSDDLATLPSTVRLFVDGSEVAVRDTPAFGPEVTFAHDLADAWPGRSIVLLKYAVGGTSLLAWAPEWDADRAGLTQNEAAGPLYEHLIDMVRGVELGPSARYAGVLWMQGERDARYPDVAAAYLENLETFITRLRADLGEPELPFVLGVVNPPADRFPGADVVRAAQLEAAEVLPHTAVVEASGVTKRDDDLHYDSAGQLELGRRFARNFLALTSTFR
jgi:hypothetical protein